MEKRNFKLFLLASAFLGIYQSIDTSFFNNFLSDTFHLTVSQRTLLEFPRELPGFLVVFVSGLLISFGDIRIAFIANIMAAIGLSSLGLFSSTYGIMIVWLTIYSMGQHLFMSVNNSIVMDLSSAQNMGKRLGLVSGTNTAVFLATSLFTAFFFKGIKIEYSSVFLLGALSLVISSICIFLMTSKKRVTSQKRFIYKKEYHLYYVLNILFGARKQIFITFGPWVLIKIFSQGVSTFAILGFIAAGIGIFFKPIIGQLIDKKGEKFVLAGEAILLIIVCLIYGLSQKIFNLIGLPQITLYFICGSFIADQLLMAAGMARATYLKKIALVPEDVSPTLSMGITIDHVVSMFLPLLGGLVWNAFGYEFVFFCAALLALANLFVASKIRIAPKPSI